MPSEQPAAVIARHTPPAETAQMKDRAMESTSQTAKSLATNQTPGIRLTRRFANFPALTGDFQS
jgi:hypothetical protein